MTSRKNKTHYFDNGTPRASSPTSSSCRKLAPLGVGYPTLVSFANSSLLIPHSYLFSPQHQHPDNIRHCHKSIENIRHSPHKLHAPHRSNAPTSYRHDPIDHITSREKVSPSPLPYENHPATVANAKSISEPDMKYFPAPPRAAL